MTHLEVVEKVKSVDGSTKYLFRLPDFEVIEAVHIPLEDETKMCISCQVGCINKCRHCATGKDIEYKRDLTSEEIVFQVTTMAEDNNDSLDNITILFMGMGEPLFNFENMLKSLDLFSGIGIPLERVTISTSGVIPRILEIAELRQRPKLAVSIHATTNLQRDKLIPMNKTYCLEDLLKATEDYTNLTKEEVIIQYTLIDSFNDSDEDAERLMTLTKNILCEIQVIPFNSFPSSTLNEPKPERIDFFMEYIESRGASRALKRSAGTDIYAGCGQLGCKHNPS